MQTAVAGTLTESGPPDRQAVAGTEPTGATPDCLDYLRELHRHIDDIEAQFPEVVRILRERIADLEQLLAKGGNPFIQHGAIAARFDAVEVVRRAIQRIVG